MTSASSFSGVGVESKRVGGGAGILSELRQMSRVSKQEEGLLNHAQAAVILDVSTRRIGELVELGKLTRLNFLGRTYVSVKEIMQRREGGLKAGRPRGSIRQRLRKTAKIMSHYDAVHATLDALTPEPKKPRRKKS
jgi:hypothetical protein